MQLSRHRRTILNLEGCSIITNFFAYSTSQLKGGVRKRLFKKIVPLFMHAILFRSNLMGKILFNYD